MTFKLRCKTLVSALAVTVLTGPLWANPISETDAIDIAVQQSELLEQARLFPRDIFNNRHTITALRLSPSGEKLAFVTVHGKYSKLWLHDIDKHQTVSNPVCKAL